MLAKVKIWQILAAFILISSLGFESKSQDFAVNGISSSLLKDTLTLKTGQFGFNALTISNNTSTNLQISCKTSMPHGWSLLRDLPNLIEIPAGQSTVIPMRIRAGANGYGGVKYPINIDLTDPITGQKTSMFFYVKLVENTKWKVELPQNTIYSQDNAPLPDFHFRIRNQGNRVEFYDINFESSVRLTVPPEGMQLFLKPGADTTITVGVRSRTLGQLSDLVRIHINSRTGNKTIEQKLYFVSDLYVPRESKYYVMPIYLKYQVTNLLYPKNIFQNFEINAYLPLKNKSGISISYRDNIIIDNISQNNKIYNINYHNKNTSVEAGIYQDFMYTQISGNGISYSNRNEKSYTNVFGVIPRRYNGLVLGARQNFDVGAKSELNSEFLFENNKDNRVKGSLGVLTYKHMLSNQNNFFVRAGASNENVGGIGASFNGLTYGGGLKLRFKRVSLQSEYTSYSKAFPGINRGVIRQKHSARFNLGPVFVGFFGSAMIRNTINYINNFTDFQETFGLQNVNYGSQLGMTVLGGSLSANFSQQSQLQSSLSNPLAVSQTISLNYYLKTKKTEQNFSFGNTKSRFGEINNGNFIHGWVGTMNGKIGRLGYMGRLDVGPSMYFDFLYYAKTNNYPIRQNYSLYYYSKGNKNLRHRFSLDYLKLYTESQSSLMLRQDVFIDIPKSELSMSVFSAINTLNVKQRPYLGISLTKTFNTPVPFVKKYNSLKIHLFKDENNNQQWDEDEEPVRNAKVLINNNYMRSNEDGEINLKNVNKGTYKINYQSIDNQKGWTSNNVLEDTVKLKKDLSIAIPFKKAFIIDGMIKYTPAEHTPSKSPVLDAIKITATNSKGEKFYTLTDVSGKFYFNLSRDLYTISIPSNLFGTKFKFKSNSLQVNLKDKDEDIAEFELIEKSRKINIKRLDD